MSMLKVLVTQLLDIQEEIGILLEPINSVLSLVLQLFVLLGEMLISMIHPLNSSIFVSLIWYVLPFTDPSELLQTPALLLKFEFFLLIFFL